MCSPCGASAFAINALLACIRTWRCKNQTDLKKGAAVQDGPRVPHRLCSPEGTIDMGTATRSVCLVLAALVIGAGPAAAVVSAWSALQFGRDGTVRMGQGAGATTDDVVAGSRQSAVARYRLDGHVITLSFADGHSEQRLFYFLPGNDGRRAIGVGSSTLSMR